MMAPSSDRSAPDMRRGACPALSAPMMTGDGLLARIALNDSISPAELAQICRLALTHGNGMIDISARGNLQVRGLSEVSALLLDADIRSLRLPLRDGLAVEVPPFAGLDEFEIADPRPLAEAIREGAKSIIGLAPKMSVVVDGDGQLVLPTLLADIRLVPADPPMQWTILLGGLEHSSHVLESFPARLAVQKTLGLLRRLAHMGPTARGRDLTDGLPVWGAARQPVSPFGTFSLSEDLLAVGIGPAFGQARAEQLIVLCEEAGRLGIGTVKPAFDHSLLFIGSEAACDVLQDFAAGRGFIISAADPRCHIAACPGSPACTSAAIATHEIAAQAAAECGDLLDGSFKLHVSGCPKGCAHPQASALALCGTADGNSFIHQGKAGDTPFATLAFADASTGLRRLAVLVKSERQAGEDSATCLARLGAERLAVIVTSGKT